MKKYSNVITSNNDNIDKVTYFEIGPEGEPLKKIKSRKKKRKFEMGPEYFSLGFYLIIPILIFLFLGLYLDDKFFKNGKIIPLFIMIGVISSFYNLFALTKQK